MIGGAAGLGGGFLLGSLFGQGVGNMLAPSPFDSIVSSFAPAINYGSGYESLNPYQRVHSAGAEAGVTVASATYISWGGNGVTQALLDCQEFPDGGVGLIFYNGTGSPIQVSGLPAGGTVSEGPGTFSGGVLTCPPFTNTNVAYAALP